jgi:hypothetical protein
MNMVGRAVDDERGSAHFPNDASEIGEQVVAKVGFDQRPTSLGAENEMQKDISGRMRHALSPLRGLP